MKFIGQHQLDLDSHPVDWVYAFLPKARKKGDGKGCNILKWCEYTDMRANMGFAGNTDSN